MISGLLKKIFGSRNDRLIKQYTQTVRRINALEPSLQGLSNEQLRAKTDEFRQRHASGEALDDLLPEAFAVVREAGKRSLRVAAQWTRHRSRIAIAKDTVSQMGTG